MTYNNKYNYTPIAKLFNKVKSLGNLSKAGQRFAKRIPQGMPINRLSYGAITPKEDRSIRDLFDMINDGPLRSRIIFPDTGFLTTPMIQDFWRIGRGRSFAFSEMTAHELSGWIRNPIHNQTASHWISRGLDLCKRQEKTQNIFREASVFANIGHDLVNVKISLANKDGFISHAYNHYVDMLSLRKRVGSREHSDFTKEKGYSPTDSEFKNHLNKKYGPVIAPLAFKGLKDIGKRNFLADEELVVTAVFTALATETETLILTRDNDIFSQFCTLVNILTSDYACCRYAECHYKDSASFPLFDLPISSTDDIASSGISGDNIKTVSISHEDAANLFPYSFTPINVSCVLVGNTLLDPKVSISSFCIESEMNWLLETKFSTGGLNTNRFPGRNMIVGTQIDENFIGPAFFLVSQIYTDYEGIRVSVLDLQQALNDPKHKIKSD